MWIERIREIIFIEFLEESGDDMRKFKSYFLLLFEGLKTFSKIVWIITIPDEKDISLSTINASYWKNALSWY